MRNLDSRKGNEAYHCSSITPPISQAPIPWFRTSGCEVGDFSDLDLLHQDPCKSLLKTALYIKQPLPPPTQTLVEFMLSLLPMEFKHK